MSRWRIEFIRPEGCVTFVAPRTWTSPVLATSWLAAWRHAEDVLRMRRHLRAHIFKEQP